MNVAARTVPVAALVLAAPAAPADVRAGARTHVERAAASLGGLAFVTCHRVELHLPSGALAAMLTDGIWATARALEGEPAARHLVSTAIGLESAVVAEDQVLHQLRSSAAAARARGPLTPELDMLIDVALRAGRTARAWRPRQPRSLADLAVDHVAGVHGGRLDGRRVLVVGAGEMGRLAAAAAARLGARVAVASPTVERARHVATSVAGEVLQFDPGPDGEPLDGIVVALSGPWLLGERTVDRLARAPLVVDLSMPPALPERLVWLLGARLIDLDRLGADARDSRQADPDGAVARYRRRLEALREQTVERYLERLAARDRAGIAGALAERIERERSAELDALWHRLPDLPAEERAAIEGMTRHLAKRLLGAPLARLGSDPDGRRRRAAEELFEL